MAFFKGFNMSYINISECSGKIIKITSLHLSKTLVKSLNIPVNKFNFSQGAG